MRIGGWSECFGDIQLLAGSLRQRRVASPLRGESLPSGCDPRVGAQRRVRGAMLGVALMRQHGGMLANWAD
jgi:hypothetical protein